MYSSDGELLPSGVVEELYREVSAQMIRNLPTPPGDGSQDGMRLVGDGYHGGDSRCCVCRAALSAVLTILNRIANATQDGEYDTDSAREALVCVFMSCMSVRLSVYVHYGAIHP